MKKIYLFLLCFLILFSLVGCSSNEKSSSDKYAKILKEAKVSGEKFKKNYFSKEREFGSGISFLSESIESLDDIKRLSDISVQGVVVSSEPCILGEYSSKSPYAKVTFYINKVLIGDKSLVGTEIVIYEAGGIISKRDLGLKDKFPNMTDSELSEEVVQISNGVANSIPGTEMILFVKKFPKTYLNVDTDFYGIFANYLSRFDKNKSGYYEIPKPILADSNFISNENIKKINFDVNQMIN